MPVITISRMYGSEGSEVAERVARTLGWALFDNAMIDAIAERSGLTRAEVTAQDERVPSLVERLASALSLGTAVPARQSRPTVSPLTSMLTSVHAWQPCSASRRWLVSGSGMPGTASLMEIHVCACRTGIDIGGRSAVVSRNSLAVFASFIGGQVLTRR